MQTKTLEKNLNLALNAANLAAKAIINEKKNLKIWQKDDKSFVSSADIKANEIITECLKSSDLAILSEEQIPPLNEREKMQDFWLIDPLDGTSGFLKNSDEFCIMIALISQNRPKLALIKSPINNECFYAHEKSKIYKNNEILNVNLSKFKENKNKALLSVNHLSFDDENFAKTHNLKALNIGSGLKFSALLQGEAGVYKRFEKLHIWDIAAGDFLLNQSGGAMFGFNANLIFYNATTLFAPPFLAVSRKEFLEDFL